MHTIKLFIAGALAIGAFNIPAYAQSKLSMEGTAMLEEYRAERAQRIRALGLKAVEAEPSPRAGAIVLLNDGNTAECLREKGFEVVSDLGGIATISVPLDSVDILLDMPQVKSVSMGGKKRLLMDKARPASKVTDAHNGISMFGTTTKYTGAGVVLGLMDGGLMPNHVNFKNADGTSRVKRVWAYSGDNGYSKEYSTPSAINSFTTENEQATHGTHVAGIMAGSYNKTGKYYNTSTVTNGTIPYYGVATEADLAISCGALYDENILDGVEKVIEYAESQGQPVAVNLSLGSNSGPHDGSDAFTQALDALGQRGIICVAAGNEGEENITAEKTFTESDTELKTFVYYNNLYASNIDGVLDIWGSDDKSLTVTISAYDTSTKKLSAIVAVSGQKNASITRSPYVTSGTAKLYAGVDANNNRYNVYIDCDALKFRSNKRMVITVKGEPGQRVNLYFDGSSEFCASPNGPSGTPVEGYTPGTPDNSISGMACGDNMIVVGAYVSRMSWGTASGMDGYNSGYGLALNDVCGFSSYGKRFQGDNLPHVCAPGAGIISSYSRYYVNYCEKYGLVGSPSSMTASAANGNATDYWGEMEGTSMATPYVTGVMGLWLQADPNLTAADIKEIINETSINDSYTAKNPEKWGAGKIDAAAGLRKILADLASIGSVADNLSDETVSVTVQHGNIEIIAAGTRGFTASLYGISGEKVACGRSDNDMLTLEAGNVRPGIYVLDISSESGRTVKKLVLK